MLSFENSIYLWWALAIPVLVFLFYRLIKWKKKTALALGDKNLVGRLLRFYSAKHFRWKFYLVCLALLLGVLAAAGLRKQTTRSAETTTGVDLIFALDVSKSMLSQDIKPTRLDRAKQLIGNLSAHLQNNRIGLVVFAGQAILQMPLTDDIGALNMYLPNVNTDMVPIQGTEVGAALLVADNALNPREKKHKAVLLITDGETHDKTSEKAAKKLYGDGVTVITVGIGTPKGAPIFDPVTQQNKKDKNGNIIISKLNEKELKNIADITHGSYMLLNNDRKAIETIVAKVDSMEKKLVVTGKVGSRHFFYLFPFIISIALVILIAELFISERKHVLT